jgi:hypothetical protein
MSYEFGEKPAGQAAGGELTENRVLPNPREMGMKRCATRQQFKTCPGFALDFPHFQLPFIFDPSSNNPTEPPPPPPPRSSRVLRANFRFFDSKQFLKKNSYY